MNTQELLKAYAQFDKQGWAINARRLKTEMQDYVKNTGISFAFADCLLSAVIEAYRGAAVEWLETCFFNKLKGNKGLYVPVPMLTDKGWRYRLGFEDSVFNTIDQAIIAALKEIGK